VRVAFVHPDWQERSGEYRRDLRGPGTAGETWELEVRSSTAADPVTLELSELVPASPEPAVRLIDREQGSLAEPMRAGGTPSGAAAADPDGDRSAIRYPLVSFGPRPYRLAIVAGSEEYVANATKQALAIPARVTLDRNAPNPFRGATRIRFGLPRAERVTLEIYSVLGQRVATPLDRTPLDPGYHTLVWDGTTAGGRTVPSGVYLLRLGVGREALTQRLVRIQ
jgi:hypothetical protein